MKEGFQGYRTEGDDVMLTKTQFNDLLVQLHKALEELNALRPKTVTITKAQLLNALCLYGTPERICKDLGFEE